jgi:hypothetical protein
MPAVTRRPGSRINQRTGHTWGTKLIPKGYELRHTKTLRVQDLSLGPPERELLARGITWLPRSIAHGMFLGSLAWRNEHATPCFLNFVSLFL